MAIYVYNTKQQALTSKKIAELFSFTSNDFGGLISNVENPILFDSTENTKTWNWSIPTPVEFIGGGLKIECDVEQTPYIFNTSFIDENIEYRMYGLDITVPSNNSSIINNILNEDSAKVIQVDCKAIEKKNLYVIINYPSGNPSLNGYYEYSSQVEEETGEYILSEDTVVDETKTYYYMLPNYSYTITNAKFIENGEPSYKSFDYYGNTVWLSANRFFIPFCSIDKNNNMDCMIFNRDKTGYESFLTARTYYHLLNELGNKFVFRVGGPTKGDIGKLNVTDNVITNKEDIISDNNIINGEGVKIINPAFDINTSGDIDLDHILIRNEESGKIYKTNDTYVIPIKHGGTNANIESNARINLGFTYGPNDPTITPKRINGDIDEGAVYFKLL